MLPQDIQNRLERDFGAESPTVRIKIERLLEDLADFGVALAPDRIARCIIHLAAGSRQQIDHFIKAALEDPRDVIYWAEYDAQGRSIRDLSNSFPPCRE